MSAVQSKLTYPNRFARTLLSGMEEVMGNHGLESALAIAELSRYSDHRFPADTLERGVDFTAIAALNRALDELYGVRGGRGMALRAGRAWFSQGLHTFGALAGVSDPAFRALPLEERGRVGLNALANIFNHFSDQGTRIDETKTHFQWIVQPCATAWGNQSERPMCHPIVGLLQETMRWVSNGREYSVRETTCTASGAEACIFAIHKQPL